MSHATASLVKIPANCKSLLEKAMGTLGFTYHKDKAYARIYNGSTELVNSGVFCHATVTHSDVGMMESDNVLNLTCDQAYYSEIVGGRGMTKVMTAYTKEVATEFASSVGGRLVTTERITESGETIVTHTIETQESNFPSF